MNFEEALKAMREGKKVTVSGYRRAFFIVDEANCLLKGYYNPDMKYPVYDEVEMLGGNSIMSDTWEVLDK